MNAVTRSTHAPTSDERRAHWAFRYFGCGLHRQPQKPRIRVTVPAPRPPVRDCPQGEREWKPLVTVPQPRDPQTFTKQEEAE